jgi:REP element-mobilizing transposase RayT
MENRGKTGRFRLRAIVVLFARGSIRTRHRSGHPAPCATQPGNARQLIFTTDVERLVYLDLLRHYCTLHRLSRVGYCLMSNHVHLIVIPKQLDSLAATLKNTHGRYAAYWNAQHRSSGRVGQGRFYSCPLGGTHLAHLGGGVALHRIESRTSGPARVGRHEREGWLRRIPIRGPAPLFTAERRRQTYHWIRDFGSSPGQPVIGGTISGREPRQPRPLARAPIPDGRSAHRNLSKGWNATPAAPSGVYDTDRQPYGHHARATLRAHSVS